MSLQVLRLMYCSAGLLPAWDAIPEWWKWYGYINPLRYGYGAVAINGFEGRPDVMLGGLPVRRSRVVCRDAVKRAASAEAVQWLRDPASGAPLIYMSAAFR